MYKKISVKNNKTIHDQNSKTVINKIKTTNEFETFKQSNTLMTVCLL